MANVKISELDEADMLDGTEDLVIVQDGETVRCSTQDVADLAGVPKVYAATINQTGTSAPVATVFKNTLSGAIVWSRTSGGNYVGTLSGAFPASKTFMVTGEVKTIIRSDTGNIYDVIESYRLSDNTIELDSSTGTIGSASGYTDGLISNFQLKIEVYR